ncbi:hypothetical protein [Amantichitinum ursilacus]|uniref:hypothetical protein n=1 Tax=Amantichitinum ursilacus TaxID=857265 RepID=UPI0006B641C8|nr:hypothetical protein [Amantichitinum ursilacus]
MNLYLKALLRMMDKSDGRVRGPRRTMLSWAVTEVGLVKARGALPRPLQHQEVVRLLDELVIAGAVENFGDATELHLVLVHRKPGMVAA